MTAWLSIGRGAVCLAVLATTAVSSRVQAADAPSDPMQIVRERNIFDPNRRAGRRRDEARETNAPPRVRMLAVTGTMIHADRELAFFGGSESEYHKVTSVDGGVGAFTVARITRDEVELKEGDRTMVVAVGKSLKQVGDGPWQMSEEAYVAEAATASPGDTEGGGSQATAAAAPNTGGGNDEIRRRMMERRRQEESR